MLVFPGPTRCMNSIMFTQRFFLSFLFLTTISICKQSWTTYLLILLEYDMIPFIFHAVTHIFFLEN
jgi:hypothetical protein